MTIRYGVAALAAGAILGGCSSAQEAGDAAGEGPAIASYDSVAIPGDGVVIPFRMGGDQILVDGVEVNGQGPYTFAFDSGAQGGGRADVSLANALGLKQTGEVESGDTSDREGRTMPLYRFDSLRVGGLRYEGVEVASRDYNTDRAVAARGRVDGFLGMGLFQESLFTIDYPNSEFRVDAGALPPADGAAVLALDRDEPVPTTTVEIDGAEHVARLDTGAMAGILISDEIAAGLTFVSEPTVVGQAASVNGEFDISMGVVDGVLRLGSVEVENPQVIITEPFPDVIFGAQFLRNYEITLDFANGRLSLVDPDAGADASAEEPRAEPRRRYGIMVSPPAAGDSAIPVLGLVPGGVAEERGLLAGDEIVRVNGAPVAELDAASFGAAMTSTPLSLVVMRDGEELEVELAWDAE